MSIGIANKQNPSFQTSESESISKKNVDTGSGEMMKIRQGTEQRPMTVPEKQKDTIQTQDNKEVQNSESVKRAVEEINKRSRESEAIFGFHDATNRVVIKIVDKKTKEIMKEFPPEETLDMIAKIWELAGILIDEKG